MNDGSDSALSLGGGRFPFTRIAACNQRELELI